MSAVAGDLICSSECFKTSGAATAALEIATIKASKKDFFISFSGCVLKVESVTAALPRRSSPMTWMNNRGESVIQALWLNHFCLG